MSVLTAPDTDYPTTLRSARAGSLLGRYRRGSLVSIVRVTAVTSCELVAEDSDGTERLYRLSDGACVDSAREGIAPVNLRGRAELAHRLCIGLGMSLYRLALEHADITGHLPEFEEYADEADLLRQRLRAAELR